MQTYNETLEEGAGICENGRPAVKKGKPEDRLSGKVNLPHKCGNNAKNTNNNGGDDLGAVPLKLDTRPRNPNEEARHPCGKEEATHPVDTGKLRHERSFFRLELHVNGDQHQAEDAERELLKKKCQ